MSTGRIPDADSVFVPWPFAPLASGEKGAVRVRAHAADGRSTAWSDPAEFSVGLLCRADWTGQFISPYDSSGFRGAHHLRRRFHVTGHVRRAVLHMSALGVFTPFLNGSSVGDHVLDPGWTSYRHRICSSSFDVTDLVVEGDNVLAVLVADGWYRGRLGYGPAPSTTSTARGSQSSANSRSTPTTTRYASSLTRTGERRRVRSSPPASTTVRHGTSELTFPDGHERLTTTRRGTPSSPFWSRRQSNPCRWPRFVVPARDGPTSSPEATRRSCSTSARTSSAGSASKRPAAPETRSSSATRRYCRTERSASTRSELPRRPTPFILAGRERQKCEPCFTFHGFRYAELSGAVGSIDLDSVEAVVIHSDLERTGWFESSDPDLDRLHENVVWSMRGNFVSLPTDCPQRDERMGWTGDIQVFAPTACFVYDVGGFLSSWLTDLALEQLPNGAVPNVIPDLHIRGSLPDDEAAAAWGDAATVVPWALYQRLGDKGVLERNYEGMKGWVGWVESRLSENDVWDSGWQYGDWLDPAAPADSPHLGLTEPALVATAYAIRSSDILAGVARMLDASETASATRPSLTASAPGSTAGSSPARAASPPTRRPPMRSRSASGWSRTTHGGPQRAHGSHTS